MSSQLQTVFSAFVSSRAGAEESCKPSAMKEDGPTAGIGDHGIDRRRLIHNEPLIARVVVQCTACYRNDKNIKIPNDFHTV